MSVRVAFPVRFAICYDAQGHLVQLVAVLQVDRGRTTVGAWSRELGLPLRVWDVQGPWVAGREVVVQQLLAVVVVTAAVTVHDRSVLGSAGTTIGHQCLIILDPYEVILMLQDDAFELVEPCWRPTQASPADNGTMSVVFLLPGIHVDSNVVLLFSIRELHV